jgi:hypothetical protein
MTPPSAWDPASSSTEERVDMTVTAQDGGNAASLASISTSDRAESRTGTWDLDDRAPTDRTAALRCGCLDLVNPVDAFDRGSVEPSDELERPSIGPLGDDLDELVAR